MKNHHVLLVTFPGQGHINPSLQFAKRLANHGLSVTFLTALYATRRMPQTPFHPLVHVISFPTGFDDSWSQHQFPQFVQALADHGSSAVESLVAEQGRPFSHVVYTPLVPWAGQVARRLGLPATLLWIQSAIVFGFSFHHYNRSLDATAELIDLPGLPLLRSSDLPSSFKDEHPNALLDQKFQNLDAQDHPMVLLNTFDALESVVVSKYKLMAIGPLIPSAFLDGNDPSDTSFGADLIKKSEDYMQYLECAEKESVIYVAFGSYSELPKPQMEAIEEGLIRSGRPFLWVIRGSEDREKLDQILGRREDLEKQGKIVAWCTQVEVLSHPSVGCFVTHCGWNSTLEGLSSGVPMVMVPQWIDQITNAKLVQDVWRSGVRAERGGEEEIVEADEIERCLEIVMDGGDAAREMREQANKWRDLARDAMKEGGTSNLNLKIFVDQIVDSSNE